MVRPKLALTQVASRAVSFADLFNEAFRDGLPGPIPCTIELTTPGASTGGGKQIVQHITLVPYGGGPSIVVGSINGMDGSAELRTYNHLTEIHARRFKGARLPLDHEVYKTFVRRMQEFFQSQRFNVVLVEVSPSVAPPPDSEEQSSSSTGLVIAILFVLVFVLGGVGAVVARRYGLF